MLNGTVQILLLLENRACGHIKNLLQLSTEDLVLPKTKLKAICCLLEQRCRLQTDRRMTAITLCVCIELTMYYQGV